MNYIVFLKMVPDVVEELKIGVDGKSLDDEWLRLKLNECDEHAVEEAVLMKEKYGGNVTVVALDGPELEDTFYMALAKGVDKVVRIIGDWQEFRSPAIASVYAKYLRDNDLINSDTLILSGSQSIDDLEGETIYYLSEYLQLPVFGVITHIEFNNDSKKLSLIKEFSGGVRGQFETSLPVILGVQAAENPPRYIPIAKMRNIMKTAVIEEVEIPADDLAASISIDRMFEPEVAGKAEMLEGSPDDISDKLIEIFSEKGII